MMQGGNKCAAAEAQLAELSAKVEAFEQRAADAEVRSATMADKIVKLRADLFSKANAQTGVRSTYIDCDMQLLSHTCSGRFQMRLAIFSPWGKSVAAQIRQQLLPWCAHQESVPITPL